MTPGSEGDALRAAAGAVFRLLYLVGAGEAAVARAARESPRDPGRAALEGALVELARATDLGWDLYARLTAGALVLGRAAAEAELDAVASGEVRP